MEWKILTRSRNVEETFILTNKQSWDDVDPVNVIFVKGRRLSVSFHPGVIYTCGQIMSWDDVDPAMSYL